MGFLSQFVVEMRLEAALREAGWDEPKTSGNETGARLSEIVGQRFLYDRGYMVAALRRWLRGRQYWAAWCWWGTVRRVKGERWDRARLAVTVAVDHHLEELHDEVLKYAHVCRARHPLNAEFCDAVVRQAESLSTTPGLRGKKP